MSVYKIAGLGFCIESEEFDSFFYHNYRPFRVEAIGDAPLLFRMDFKPLPAVQGEPTCCFHTDRGVYRIWLQEYFYIVEFQLNGSKRKYRMRADKSWSQVETDIYANGLYDPLVLNELILIAFVYSAAFHDAVLLHASSIRYGERGVAFIGPSGIGKSTHSLLWLEHIRGACLLNDDQPVVRLIEGIPYVFGSPWSGKTVCFKNESARLEALFLMEQALENRIDRLPPVPAFQKLLASCAMIKQDEKTFACITETLSSIAGKVKMFHLRSKPEKAAAELSFKYGITK